MHLRGASFRYILFRCLHWDPPRVAAARAAADKAWKDNDFAAGRGMVLMASIPWPELDHLQGDLRHGDETGGAACQQTVAAIPIVLIQLPATFSDFLRALKRRWHPDNVRRIIARRCVIQIYSNYVMWGGLQSFHLKNCGARRAAGVVLPRRATMQQ